MQAHQQPILRYMNPATYTIGQDASLAEIDTQMGLRGVSALVVVDDEAAPVGVVTRTDLLRLGRPYDARTQQRTLALSDRLLAADVFQRDPVSIDQQSTVREAARLMYKRQVHRLLVVDGAQAVGVLSVTDLLHVVAASALPTPLSELASETIAWVDADASLQYATERLSSAGVRGLVVLRQGHPEGCFTQREALAARDAPSEAKVDSWMNPSIVCLTEDTPLPHAARQAILTHAPIIVSLRDGEPRGVVTATDMIYALL